MKSIGGNTLALFQVKVEGGRNAIGECENSWIDTLTVNGWLDLSNGDSKRTVYSAKIQESTHIFLCDYQPLTYKPSTDAPDAKVITSENARIIIEGQVYDIMLIDDPMLMHQHLEIYLKFTGGQDV